MWFIFWGSRKFVRPCIEVYKWQMYEKLLNVDENMKGKEKFGNRGTSKMLGSLKMRVGALAALETK